MEDNTDLDKIDSAAITDSYNYNLALVNYEGECSIIYSTNSPLLASGQIQLKYVTSNVNQLKASTDANPGGGIFKTGKPWATGFFAEWRAQDANGKYVTILKTATTS